MTAAPVTAAYRDTSALTLGFLTIGAQAAPLDVLQAAHDAGFGAAGLRISGRNPGNPWVSPATTETFDGLRERARECGVRISSISGYYMSDKTTLHDLLRNVVAAERTGAPIIAQGCFEPDRSRATALLRDYAHAAADAGVRIALEFMPMSAIKSIADAQRIIQASGARNVGLLIDALHLARSGADACDVRLLDPSSIMLTQLCDASATLGDRSLMDEAMTGRMYPGDGGLDLASLVQALPAGAEIELETPVVADAGLPASDKARRAAAKARVFFADLSRPLGG